MVGASDVMKHEKLVDSNFHRWRTRVKFWLMSMGLWWVIHLVIPLMVEQTTTFLGDTTLECILSL